MFYFAKRGAMLLEDIIKFCDGKSNPIKFFSADLILKATHNFNNSNQIPEIQSSYWDWYSGVNDNSRMILFKKYTDKTYNFESNFCRDVTISSMVSGHKNFMKLVGCCLELEHPIMVHYGEKEQYYLIDYEKIVSWKRRMKIAEDIAIALAYLHTAFTTPFVYRNMSIENILIDENGVAKLSDLSLCISIPLGKTFVRPDVIVGTLGYMDENFQKGLVSETTDVYGFGMFMLMLIFGGRERFVELAVGYGYPEWVHPMWVSKFIEEGRLIHEIVDPKMGEVTEEEHCNMKAFPLLSMRCVSCKREVLTMVEVAKELKKIRRSYPNASS